MARITVEDCLRSENNRFALILLSSKRAKQLLTGGKSVIDSRHNNKCIVTALREIADGKVRFMTAEEIAAEDARLAEERARAAEEREARATNGDSGMVAPMMPQPSLMAAPSDSSDDTDSDTAEEDEKLLANGAGSEPKADDSEGDE